MSKAKPASILYRQKTMAFKSIELFKTETLGTGSYGAVFKAKCDQLICAAKLLYPVLFKVQMNSSKDSEDHRLPFQRFESECRFLSLVQHPNIVQYLGTYRDPDTNAPVLLMELMDESLTHFLESSPGDIPYHIQVNLSYDIAQALAFLHSNDIVHRDLSSNNVLLLSGRAKIGDFGMSKFETSFATMTTCPGTAVYMSPEALNTPPVYTEKLDMFSFGVLMIQIMTREFPQPAVRLATKEVIDPSNPKHRITALVVVSEAQRRCAQVSRVNLTNPLLQLAQQCIRDIDITRPSATDLCGILTCVKESTKYKKSTFDGVHNQKRDEQLIEKIINLKDTFEKKETELREKDQKLKEMTEMLKTAKNEIRQLKERSDAQNKTPRKTNYLHVVHSLPVGIGAGLDQIHERPTRHSEGAISPLLSLQSRPLPSPTQRPGEWGPLLDCPINLQAGSSTVVGNKAYFQNRDTGAIAEYNSANGQWCITPYHPLKQCGLGCFENTLTTVGGYDDQSTVSNKVLSLVDNKWKEKLPSMPTRRDCPAVISTSTSLIVAGGRNRFQTPLKTVEVLGIHCKQWTVVTALPFLAYQSSAVVHDGYVYMTSGEGGYNHPQYSVIKCPIDVLQSQENAPIYGNTASMLATQIRRNWQNVSDLPIQHARLAEVNGHLLALGGSNPPKAQSLSPQAKGTQAVYEYNPIQNTWNCISHMAMSRHRCLTAVLPGNKVIVVGGIPTGNERSKCTEYTTLDN